MKELEISAKTVEEATKKALEQLGVGLSEVEVTILHEARGGILGLGAGNARIRVRTLEPEIPEEQVQEPTQDVSKIARDAVETLLNKLGMTATVSTPTEPFESQTEGSEDLIALDIKGDDLGGLIGRRGQTLESLQYIVRLIVAQKTKAWVPIVIDVEDYKRRRFEALRTLAHHIAEQVRTTRTSFKLEAMPPAERRIIHLTLANDPDVTTESTGEGDFRKVVVMPKRK
jgi:spoIIIJ-associated protein